LSSYRPERVGEQIHKEIAQLMMHGIKDPRVAPVTITGVKVSKDLSVAKVFFTVLDEGSERKDAERGLKSVAPYLRRQLGQIIRMRFIPELRFEYDKSISYGRKIDDLLRQVQDDLKEEPSDDSADR
jgi:ribosome-binding factor A